VCTGSGGTSRHGSHYSFRYFMNGYSHMHGLCVVDREASLLAVKLKGFGDLPDVW
jgi:hypothetical protein